MSGLAVRRARSDEYERIRAFYYRLIDDYGRSDIFHSWKKNVYPSDKQLREAVERGELYAGEADGELVACMVLNRAQHEGYRQVKWSVRSADEEVMVIHLLGVALACAGRGFAREMASAAVELARGQGLRTVRLDVLGGNLRAERAYIATGFRYVDTLRLYYENTGLTEFRLFEYVF